MDPRHEVLIKALGKGAKFLSIFESDIGQELLKDATDRMQALLLKIIEEDASPEEHAEYRALRDITRKWLGKIKKYQDDMKKLK